MKKNLLLVLFFLISTISYSQKKINLDSLLTEMCNTFKVEKNNYTDSNAILYPFVKHLLPIADSFTNKQFDSIYLKCFFKLQIDCFEFKQLLDKISPQKGDWQSVTSEPISNASQKDCNDFFKIAKFKYLEVSGNKTAVTLSGSTWVDTFADGTYSKLSLTRDNANEFTLTFIESNNISRKNMSQKGDRYKYKIIERQSNYFQMCVTVVSNPKNKYLFKMYF